MRNASKALVLSFARLHGQLSFQLFSLSIMMQLRAVRTLTGCTNAQLISVLAVCLSPIPTCHASYLPMSVHICSVCERRGFCQVRAYVQARLNPCRSHP